jgi:hypothetical protein
MSANAQELAKTFFETLMQIREIKVPGTNRESQAQFSAEINKFEQ